MSLCDLAHSLAVSAGFIQVTKERIHLCLWFTVIMALLAATPLAFHLERAFGLSWLYGLGDVSRPVDDAVIIGVDDQFLTWLKLNADDLPNSAPVLSACLDATSRGLAPLAERVAGLVSKANNIPRDIYACLVDELTKRDVSLIVFDINFNTPKSDEDQLFAEAIRRAGNVLLLVEVDTEDQSLRGKIVKAPTKALRTEALDTVDFRVGPADGGTVIGYRARPDEELASMPVRAAEAVCLPAKATPSSRPLSEFELFRLYGPGGTLTTLDLREIFGPEEALGNLPSGSVVFIGASSSIQRAEEDLFATPRFYGADQGRIAGVELAATAYLNLCQDHRLILLSSGERALYVGLFALALSLGILLPRWNALVAFAGVAAIGAAVPVVLFRSGVWAPIVFPLAVCLPVAVLLRQGLRSRVLARIARATLPRKYLDVLVARGLFDLTPTKSEAAVMFIDIVDSTGLAERHGPELYSQIVKDYYARVGGAVDRYGGTVFETKGDGVLAVFFKEETGLGCAKAACMAALYIGDDLVRERAGGASPQIRVRVGIAFGPIVTGVLKIGEYIDVAAVGATVHAAARLQEMGKQVQSESGAPSLICLVDEATAEAASLGPEMLVSFGTHTLRGLSSPTSIYRLVPHHG